MKVHFHKLALTACFAALFAFQLSAQVLTGSISGNVTDASGAVLPEATIAASSPAMSGSRQVAADGSGAFKLLELPPGTYEIRVSKTGFRPVVAQNITINTGVDVKQDIRMEIGDVTQAVTVEAQAATIDTEHVTLQQVAGQAQMEGIPNGRSPWAIGGTVAAVTSSNYDVGGSGGMQQAGLTSHGSNTGSDQKFMIDGVSVNWPGGGGGATLMYYDMGMFQEVNYIIGASPADISQGGVYMNMITKDGGNAIHGTLLGQYANDSMQSNNINPDLANKLFANQSAATLARLDRTKVSPGNVILKNYDYNAQLGGAFIKDKLWWFTSWRIWGVDNYVAGSFNTNGTQVLNDNRISDEMGKISYQPNQKNRFGLMYFRNQKNRYHRVNQGLFGDQDSTSVLQNQPAFDLDLKWTYVPNSKWVLDVGAALTAGKTPYRYQNKAPAGAISVFDSSLNTVYNIAQYTYLNPVFRVAIDAFASYYTSNASGNHNVKFGFQYSRDGYNQKYIANGDLQGTFQNGVATTALLYNTPVNEQKNGLTIPAFYGMDTWTIKRRLTINAGLRWEQWKGSLPAQTSPAGTYVAARNLPEQKGIINWKDVTPRFGFSLDLLGKGKTVLKGSFNKYVQGEGMNLLTAVNPLGLITATVPWACSAASQSICRDRGPLQSELNLTNFNGFNSLLPKIDSTVTRPYSYEESIGIQQQLPGGMIVAVTGWYRSTRNQLGRINVATPASAYTAFTTKNPVTGAPLTLYSAPAKANDLRIVNSSLLDQFYRGIDVTVQRRLSKGAMLGGGLTYGGNNGATFGDVNSNVNGFDDLNNPNFNINRSGATGVDSTVNFKLNGTYTLPFKISIAGNFQHASGFPLQNRWNINPGTVGVAGLLPAGTVLGQNGNPAIYLVKSGTERLPTVNLMDLRFSRAIRIKERLKVEPTFDIYNLFNANTITSVNQSYDAGALFRNPTGVLFSRSVKVGVKIDF